MALARIRLGLFAGLLLLGTQVFAQAEPSVPDPNRLESDWWTYLSPAEPLSDEAFKDRVKNLDETLVSLERKLETAARADLGKLISSVREKLQNYVSTRASPAPETETVAPPAAEYTLNSALERFATWRALERDIVASGEDLVWQQDLLAAKRRQLSRRKVQYLELSASDPNRARLGLEIIQERLEIETSALLLGRREARLQNLHDNAASMAEALAAVADRLHLEPDEKARWQTRLEAAQKTAEQLRAKIDAGGKSGADAETLGDDKLARAEALRVINLDAEATLQDLIALQSELAVPLIALIDTGEISTSQSKEVRDRLSTLLKDLERKRKYWDRAATRARETSAVDLSGERGAPSTEQSTQGRKLLESVERINLNVSKLDRQKEETVFTEKLLIERTRLSQGLAKQWLQETGDILQNAWLIGGELLSATLFEVNETPVTTLGLIRVVVILAISLLISKGIRRTLSHLAEIRSSVSKSSLYTLGRVIHYFVLGIGIIIGLSSIGIDFTKFALLASALGIGIGFGLQTLVSNFVAGLIILFEKSLKIGDFVELESGIAGEVRDINMRSTLVTTNDNIDILVPNSEFVNKQVTNWTMREAFRRVKIPFGVAYGTSKELVEQAVMEAANNVPWTLQTNKRRKPQVWFVGFGDSALNFELVVWLTPEAVKRPGAVNAKFLWEIDNKLREYNIEVPFPQRDLNVRSLFGSRDQQGLDLLRELLERQKAAEESR